MQRDVTYFVYILASHTRVLYVGVTNSLVRRVGEHRAGKGGVFTRRYRVHRLVYYESFQYIANAINRERELKGWLRSRKVELVTSLNPQWRDLFEDFGKPVVYEPPSGI